jgi:hypothetical protein
MKPSDVERWVAQIVDEVDRQVRREDDRVELKRRPKETPVENARRIAGHANQVREGRIIWIFGLDEDGTRHPPPEELSDPNRWWQPIEACFDEVAPSPVFVSVDGLLAVGFATERVPFVVKHPGDIATREIPWREGTRVRSASRFDVLRLLVPVSTLPRISVLDGFLNIICKEPTDAAGDLAPAFEWRLQVWLYAETTDGFVVPDHLLSVSATTAGGSPPVELDAHATDSMFGRGADNVGNELAARSHRQLVVSGPTPFAILSRTMTPVDAPTVLPGSPGSLMFRIGIGGGQVVVVTGRLTPAQPMPADYTQGGFELIPTAGWSISP